MKEDLEKLYVGWYEARNIVYPPDNVRSKHG